MKFIFPQNYNFKNKLFGIFDYPTIFLNIAWDTLILLILNLIFSNLNIKIFLFLFLCLPLFIFSFTGFNGESIIYVFRYILKFIFKQKVFLYERDNNSNISSKNSRFLDKIRVFRK